MLADMKAKKEAKIREEEEKKIKEQKKLAKAREQTLANFESIPLQQKDDATDDGSTKKPNKKFAEITDKNCL